MKIIKAMGNTGTLYYIFIQEYEAFGILNREHDQLNWDSTQKIYINPSNKFRASGNMVLELEKAGIIVADKPIDYCDYCNGTRTAHHPDCIRYSYHGE